MINFDKYTPNKMIYEKIRIEKLFFDNENTFSDYIVSKREAKNLLNKVTKDNINQQELKQFLYNLESMENILSNKEKLAEVIGKISIKENERLKNIEFYFYRCLIKYYDNTLINNRLRQMGRMILGKCEETKNRFEIKIRNFFNGNQNFMSFLEYEFLKYGENDKIEFTREFFLYFDEFELINKKENAGNVIENILRINKGLL